MPRSLLISNFILFQLGWFACVLGGANQWALIGSLVACLIIIIHLWRAASPIPEMRLLVAALVLGMTFESLLILSNISQYANGILLPGLAPHWMALMWGLFASTLNVSMRWIRHLPLPAIALLGAIFAPLSYWAGNRFGAVIFPDTTLALITIAAGWAVLFPLLVIIARHNDGYALYTKTDNLSQRSYVNV